MKTSLLLLLLLLHCHLLLNLLPLNQSNKNPCISTEGSSSSAIWRYQKREHGAAAKRKPESLSLVLILRFILSIHLQNIIY